jgi:hypothetical protein
MTGSLARTMQCIPTGKQPQVASPVNGPRDGAFLAGTRARKDATRELRFARLPGALCYARAKRSQFEIRAHHAPSERRERCEQTDINRVLLQQPRSLFIQYRRAIHSGP